jgi:hypothetical protein
VRLTTTRLLAAGFTLTALAVAAALLLLHEREPPVNHPTPSSVIGDMRKRSAARVAEQRRQQALTLEQALQDAGE